MQWYRFGGTNVVVVKDAYSDSEKWLVVRQAETSKSRLTDEWYNFEMCS